MKEEYTIGKFYQEGKTFILKGFRRISKYTRHQGRKECERRMRASKKSIKE